MFFLVDLPTILCWGELIAPSLAYSISRVIVRPVHWVESGDGSLNIGTQSPGWSTLELPEQKKRGKYKVINTRATWSEKEGNMRFDGPETVKEVAECKRNFWKQPICCSWSCKIWAVSLLLMMMDSDDWKSAKPKHLKTWLLWLVHGRAKAA